MCFDQSNFFCQHFLSTFVIWLCLFQLQFAFLWLHAHNSDSLCCLRRPKKHTKKKEKQGAVNNLVQASLRSNKRVIHESESITTDLALWADPVHIVKTPTRVDWNDQTTDYRTVSPGMALRRKAKNMDIQLDSSDLFDLPKERTVMERRSTEPMLTEEEGPGALLGLSWANQVALDNLSRQDDYTPDHDMERSAFEDEEEEYTYVVHNRLTLEDKPQSTLLDIAPSINSSEDGHIYDTFDLNHTAYLNHQVNTPSEDLKLGQNPLYDETYNLSDSNLKLPLTASESAFWSVHYQRQTATSTALNFWAHSDARVNSTKCQRWSLTFNLTWAVKWQLVHHLSCALFFHRFDCSNRYFTCNYDLTILCLLLPLKRFYL